MRRYCIVINTQNNSAALGIMLWEFLAESEQQVAGIDGGAGCNGNGGDAAALGREVGIVGDEEAVF